MSMFSIRLTVDLLRYRGQLFPRRASHVNTASRLADSDTLLKSNGAEISRTEEETKRDTERQRNMEGKERLE